MYKKIIFYISIVFLPILVIRNFIGEGLISYIDHPYPFNINAILNNSFYVWSTVNNGYYSIVENVYWFQVALLYVPLNFFGLSDALISQIVFITPLILFIFSAYYLIRLILERESITYDFYSLFFAIILFLSPNIIQSLSFGWSTNAILQFSAGMTSIYFFLKYLQNKTINYLLLSILLTIISSFLLQYQFAVFIFLILLVVFKYNDKFSYKALSFYLLGFLLINFYWISNYIFSSTIYSISHYKSDPLVSVQFISDFNSTLKTLGLRNAQTESHVHIFQSRKMLAIIQFFTIILSLWFIVKFKINKINKINNYYIPLLIFILIFWNLALGGHSIIYLFLFKNVPFFVMFRDVFKLTAYINLSIIILLAINILPFYLKISKNKFLKYYLVIIGLLLATINSWPLLSGDLGGNARALKLPEDYIAITDKIANDQGNVLILPTPAWFSQLEWAGDVQLTNPLRAIIPIRSIYDEFDNSNLNSIQKDFIYYLYYRHDISNKNYITKNLNNFNINQIIIQKDQLNKPKELEYINNKQIIKNIEENIINIFYKSFESANFIIYDISPQFKSSIIDIKDQEGKIVNYKIDEMNNTKYKLLLNENQTNELNITLKQNFNKGWELKINNCDMNLINNTHKKIGYSNNWTVNTKEFCRDKNLQELELIYQPQEIFIYGVLISLISLGGISILLINYYRKV